MTTALTVLAQSSCDATTWPDVAFLAVLAVAAIAGMWVFRR